MIITEVSQKAKDMNKPVEVLCRSFPYTTSCHHCDTAVVIERPQELFLRTGEEGGEDLMWKCLLCNAKNTFTKDLTYVGDRNLKYIQIEGYKQLVPKHRWVREAHLGLIAFAFFCCMVLSLTLTITVMTS